MKKLSIAICLLIVVSCYSMAMAQDVNLTQDGKVPGKPFEEIQRQIDDLNSRLDLLLGQSCPEGSYMTGIDINGNIMCSETTPPPSGETTYNMNCGRSGNDTGPVGTDPFNSAHANFELEFAPELIGTFITAIGVEVSSEANAVAHVELKDAASGTVLATSENASTSALGWIEFIFSSNYEINGSRLLVNFLTADNARIYNCSNTLDFIPSGITAFGIGLENHMARSYIKILK